MPSAEEVQAVIDELPDQAKPLFVFLAETGMRRGEALLLEPDVAAVFHDSESVNRALRVLIDAARSQVDSTIRTGSD
jgi:integrase